MARKAKRRAPDRPAWMEPLRAVEGRIVSGNVLHRDVFGKDRGPNFPWDFVRATVFEWGSALIVLPPEGVNLTVLAGRIQQAMSAEKAVSTLSDKRSKDSGADA